MIVNIMWEGVIQDECTVIQNIWYIYIYIERERERERESKRETHTHTSFTQLLWTVCLSQGFLFACTLFIII